MVFGRKYSWWVDFRVVVMDRYKLTAQTVLDAALCACPPVGGELASYKIWTEKELTAQTVLSVAPSGTRIEFFFCPLGRN